MVLGLFLPINARLHIVWPWTFSAQTLEVFSVGHFHQHLAAEYLSDAEKHECHVLNRLCHVAHVLQKAGPAIGSVVGQTVLKTSRHYPPQKFARCDTSPSNRMA